MGRGLPLIPTATQPQSIFRPRRSKGPPAARLARVRHVAPDDPTCLRAPPKGFYCRRFEVTATVCRVCGGGGGVKPPKSNASGFIFLSKSQEPQEGGGAHIWAKKSYFFTNHFFSFRAPRANIHPRTESTSDFQPNCSNFEFFLQTSNIKMITSIF